VSGFFSCDTNAEEFSKDHRAKLYPDKIQRWIVAVDAKDDLNSVMRITTLWLGHQTPGLDAGKIRGFEVTGFTRQLMDLRGAETTLQMVSNIPTPSGRVYAGVKFLYTGSETSLPWPLLAPGFVVRCAEDAQNILLAVMPPEEPPVEEEDRGPILGPIVDAISEAGRPLGEVASTLGTVAKVAAWGVGGILLYQLYRATDTGRRTLVGS